MTHVSIVIVNYNSQEDTLECLESLEKIKSPGFKYSILIVDNASKEAFTLPKRLQRKEVEFIRSDANLGFTGGNNIGIHYCVEKFNSDYVLLLNNDTTVDPDFLSALIKQSAANPRVGLMCSKIYFSKGREFHIESYKGSQLGKILWYAGGAIDWKHLVASHRGVDEVDMGQFDSQSESDFATGCSVLIKREVLEKVGTFDKRFFLYMEDVDLSVRVTKAGYSIGFCSNSIVWHKNAGSSGGAGSSVHEYYQTRNRLLFAFKHGSWSELIIAVRLAIGYLLTGTSKQKQAVLHLVTAQFGKQPII